MNNLAAKIVAFAMVASAAALPSVASARRPWQNRRSQQNTWKNLGVAGAAVGIYGLVKGDRTLAAAGLLGAGYSAYRYDQDRRGSRYGYGYGGYNSRPSGGYGNYGNYGGYDQRSHGGYGSRSRGYDRYDDRRDDRYDRRDDRRDRYDDRRDRYDDRRDRRDDRRHDGYSHH